MIDLAPQPVRLPVPAARYTDWSNPVIRTGAGCVSEVSLKLYTPAGTSSPARRPETQRPAGSPASSRCERCARRQMKQSTASTTPVPQENWVRSATLTSPSIRSRVSIQRSIPREPDNRQAETGS